jgi:hypothetical protein
MGFRGFERTVSFAPDSADGRAIAAQLADFARDMLVDAQAAGEFPDLFVRAVNGRRGVSEDSVRLPGPIVYTADWVRAAAAFALARLQQSAPRLTGRYRSAFFVLANGSAVEPGGIPFGAEVFVTNDQPYSRKIQVGAKGFTDTRGLFDAVAAAVQSEFKGLVRCQVRFLRLAGGHTVTVRRRRRTVTQDLTYPAIRIDRATFGLN